MVHPPFPYWLLSTSDNRTVTLVDQLLLPYPCRCADVFLVLDSTETASPSRHCTRVPTSVICKISTSTSNKWYVSRKYMVVVTLLSVMSYYSTSSVAACYLCFPAAGADWCVPKEVRTAAGSSTWWIRAASCQLLLLMIMDSRSRYTYHRRFTY